MAKRIALLIVSLLVVGFVVAGCGSDSKDKSSDNSGSSSSQSKDNKSADDTPDNKKEAIARCREEANTIQNSSAKDLALKACDAAESGNVSKVKDAALKQCLELAKQIPDATQRKTTEDACRNKIK
jgi:hypothetical protein